MDELLKNLGWKKLTGLMVLTVAVSFSIRAFIVQYSYNHIAPKIKKDWENSDKTPHLTFIEALLMVILAVSLLK